MRAAEARQLQLTKPPKALGRLETLSIQLAGIQGRPLPVIEDKAIAVMAADHGVTAEGVSAFPAEVTPGMVFNFAAGGAGINVIGRHVGARVLVTDVGVNADLSAAEGVRQKKVRMGTANMAQGPAMTREQAVRAIEIGIELVEEELDNGLDIIATGEMGIGNTTAASAAIAALTGEPAATVTGRGTGISAEALPAKVAVIEKALAVNQPDAKDPIDVLAKVGGLEIAAMTGVFLGGARRRAPLPRVRGLHPAESREHRDRASGGARRARPGATVRPADAARRGHGGGFVDEHHRGRRPHPQRDGDLRERRRGRRPQRGRRRAPALRSMAKLSRGRGEMTSR